MKVYIADRSYPTQNSGFQTLPFNDFPKIHDWQPMGSSGSGTIIHVEGGKAILITCKHVVSRPSTITVTYHNKFSVRGDFLVADSQFDLAAIVINGDENTPSVPVARKPLPVGTAIQQAGYPRGQGPVTRQARVSRYGGRDMIVSFASIPGDSGSGLFNPQEGAMCGVVWGGDGAVAVCVPQGAVEAFYYNTCLPLFRRRPPQSPGSPPLGPPGGPPTAPEPPSGPPGQNPPMTPPEAKPSVLEAIQKRIGEIEDKLSGHQKLIGTNSGSIMDLGVNLSKAKDDFEKAKAIFKLLESGLNDLRGAGVATDANVSSVKDELTKAGSLLSKFEGKLDMLKSVVGDNAKIEDLAKVAKDVAATEAKLAPVMSLLGPYGAPVSIIAGLGVGGLGLYRTFRNNKQGASPGLDGKEDKLAKALTGLGGILDRLHSRIGTPIPGRVEQTAPPVQTMPAQDAPAMTVTLDSPEVRTEHQVVRVPDTSGEEALREALKKASNLGAITPESIRVIEDMAAIIRSGQATK